MIEYLLWAQTRTIFIAVMQGLTNPVTGTPLASMENGELIPSEGVRIDEIGPVLKEPGTYDEAGNELTPPTFVPGHHVNMAAVGALAEMLTAGMPTEGDVFARTRILSLLGAMDYEPISEIGVPEGWQGTSGVRIFDPAVVNSRVRVWAQ